MNGLSQYDVEGASNAVTVRDLDGDGEPEVMLTLNWGGTMARTLAVSNRSCRPRVVRGQVVDAADRVGSHRLEVCGPGAG